MPRAIADRRPLVAHLIYRLDVGGLENGVVNLINHLPEDRFRHAVISLTQVTAFQARIARRDVPCIPLNKSAGHGIALYGRLYRLFRRLRPSIVHSRNLAALEGQVPAWLAGVPVRIHGEHGRDVSDLDGDSRKHRWLRRLFSPWVQRYVTVSRDLERYLVGRVGVPATRVRQIYNGVDTRRFVPRDAATAPIPGAEPGRHLVLGWVGRLQPVKQPLVLVELLRRLLDDQPSARQRLRLALIGAGPLRQAVAQRAAALGVADLLWLPGARDDVAQLLRAMDLFVLPSLAEGISNTVLEAMASGLPVVATAVGGNPELIQPGSTGALVPPGDVHALHAAVRRYLDTPALLREHGQAARQLVERRFSLQAMVGDYQRLYEEALDSAGFRSALGAPVGRGGVPVPGRTVSGADRE